MDFRLGRSQWLTRVERGVCLGATLAAIWLHVIYLTHAGGLWRDEIISVRLATSSTAGEMWRMLVYESFPVLFHATLRCWWAIGLGGTDFGFRCLGFVIALSLLGAVWLNARVLRSSLPFVSLGLLAANLTLVRWGDSLRAYGLGCFLILLTLALVWSLMKAPSVGRFIAATLAAVLTPTLQQIHSIGDLHSALKSNLNQVIGLCNNREAELATDGRLHGWELGSIPFCEICNLWLIHSRSSTSW